MSSCRILILLASALLGYAALGFAAGTEKGAKVFTDACSPCHSASMRPLAGLHLSRKEWQEQIDRMSGLGADVPGRDVPALLDYLEATHGPAGGAEQDKK